MFSRQVPFRGTYRQREWVLTKIHGRNYRVAKLKVGDIYCRVDPNIHYFSNLAADKFLLINLVKLNGCDGVIEFTAWNITRCEIIRYSCFPAENMSYFLLSRPSESKS